MAIDVLRLTYTRQTQLPNNYGYRFTEDGCHALNNTGGRVTIKSILDDNTDLDITRICNGFFGRPNYWPNDGWYRKVRYERDTKFLSVTDWYNGIGTLWDTYFGYRDISNYGYFAYAHFTSEFAYWFGIEPPGVPLPTNGLVRCSIGDLFKNFEILSGGPPYFSYTWNYWNTLVVGPNAQDFNYIVDGMSGAIGGLSFPRYKNFLDMLCRATPGQWQTSTGSTRPMYDPNNGVICAFVGAGYNQLDNNLVINGEQPGWGFFQWRGAGNEQFLVGMSPGLYPGVNAVCQGMFTANATIYALFNGPNGYMDLYQLGPQFRYEIKPLVMNNHTLGVKR